MWHIAGAVLPSPRISKRRRRLTIDGANSESVREQAVARLVYKCVCSSTLHLGPAAPSAASLIVFVLGLDVALWKYAKRF